MKMSWVEGTQVATVASITVLLGTFADSLTGCKGQKEELRAFVKLLVCTTDLELSQGPHGAPFLFFHSVNVLVHASNSPITLGCGNDQVR